jgi:diphthine methyl ester acylhydrolase
VVTGSYDDHVRLFAIHDLDKTFGMKRARLLAEENLGGGVWRLDLVSHRITGDGNIVVIILASCMHAGSRIIELRGIGDGQAEEWTWAVLARFEEHHSMNYGSSFMNSRQEGIKRLTCVSTSFYDKLLCLWDAHFRVED